MASLTETAQVTRRAINYGAIGFVAITILWIVGGFAIDLYKKLNPPPAPPPTMDFGKIPAIELPKEAGRPTLQLELPTGVMPEFPDRMRVYEAPTKRSGFLDPDRAIETARSLGFIFRPDQPTETKYVWNNQDALVSKLEMDIVSGHFVLTRAWQNDPSLLTLSNFGSDQQVVTVVTNFLKKASLMPDDISGNERLITYLKADAGKLVPTISLSEADFVQVDFFRNTMEEIDPETKDVVASYDYYRPDPDRGLIRAVVSSSKEVGANIVSLEYNYTKVDYSKNGTYPIITGDEAWQELSKGGGFVTAKSGKLTSIAVRRIRLGYIDAENQRYSMPVYIFLGDQGFTAYVSAVTGAVLK